jgi:hypothetical protein
LPLAIASPIVSPVSKFPDLKGALAYCFSRSSLVINLSTLPDKSFKVLTIPVIVLYAA